jgi:hypothetical protein
MHDIQTTAEADAIAAFIAAGKVTKCPPAYVEKVTGAVALSVQSAPIARDHMPSSPQQKAKAEGEAAARRADIAAEPRKRGNPAIHEALRIMQQRRANKTAGRLARILREISGEWTTERIAMAAQLDGCATSTIRAFLRANGYGDRLPQQYRGPNKSSFKRQVTHGLSDAQVETRNKAICWDYQALVPLAIILATHDISARHALRVVREAGIPKRVMPKRPGRPPNERDKRLAAMYLSGKSSLVVAAETGVPHATTIAAIQRAGVTLRSSSEAQSLINERNGVEAKRARVIALHKEGLTQEAIAKAVGYKCHRSVRDILKAHAASGAQ